MANNIKVFLRRIWKNRFFTFLNIGGLAVGCAAALLTFLLIRYELSIDKFHSKKERIYRVVSTETYRNGGIEYDGNAPLPLADALRREFPQADKVAAAFQIGAEQFAVQTGGVGMEKKFRAQDVYYIDPALFDIFDFPWLIGDPRTALTEPYTAAITRSQAASWFGRWQDAIGRTILQGDERKPYRITGIMDDFPDNTDIRIKVALSYATFRVRYAKVLQDPLKWDNFNDASQCFFTLGKGQRIESMQAMLPGFVARHYTPLFAGSNSRDSSYFQPLSEMHFDTRFGRYGTEGWTYRDLWSMGLIGMFLLLVACINFINLATAQSIHRAKEVGVRKVLGSSRKQLFARFFGETALLVFFALILGSVLAELALPALKQLLGKPISPFVLTSPAIFLFLIATGIGMTFLAGIYPGTVLSRFDPVSAFKSKLDTKAVGGISLRRGLIVLQFLIAQLLIVGTFVITQQNNYFHSQPMGFDRNAIILIDLPAGPDGVHKNEYLKSRILQTTGAVSASLCSAPPATEGLNESYFTYENHAQPEDFSILYLYADSDYLKTFHMTMAEGRYPYHSDTVSREALINESTAKRLGFSDPMNAIGKQIRPGSAEVPGIPVVGVVRDFNNTSLKEKIRPMLILSVAGHFNKLAVRLDPKMMGTTIARLNDVFSQIYPSHLFEFSFFDETIAKFYNSETIAAKLFRIFSILAIFISCLGIYGLISFITAQKKKDIGIRKVLGASTQSILYLFLREFAILICISFLIAAPLGYYFMSKWLAGYYYHINIGWDIFAFTFLLSVAIAFLTVGYKSLKAAAANPIKNLRKQVS